MWWFFFFTFLMPPPPFLINGPTQSWCQKWETVKLPQHFSLSQPGGDGQSNISSVLRHFNLVLQKLKFYQIGNSYIINSSVYGN